MFDIVPALASCALCASFGLLYRPQAGAAPPFLESAKSGLPSQKIFLKIFFYIFAFVIEVFKPVGVVSSFAGFFRVECLKIEYFLDVWVVIGCRNAKFGYF